MQVLTENLGFGEKVNIRDVHLTDDDNGLGHLIDQAIYEMGAPQFLQEFNVLAIKLQSMTDKEREIFGAALQSPWCGDTLEDIISLTENLDRFELLPADADVYGQVMLDSAQGSTAELFERLKNSDNSEEQYLAEYIEHLEQSVAPEAYGKLIAKEEGGVFTDLGYLRQVEEMTDVQNIPATHQLAPATDTTVLKVDCLNGRLNIGDLVLAAPYIWYPSMYNPNVEAKNEEIFASLVGTVTELAITTTPGAKESAVAVVDFTTPEYSDKRLIEIDGQLGGHYGRATTPGVWPPIDVDCASMRVDSLMRVTDLHPDYLKPALDSRDAAEALFRDMRDRVLAENPKAFDHVSSYQIVDDTDLTALVMQMHVLGGDLQKDAPQNIETLEARRSTHYLMIMTGHSTFLTEAAHVYRHGSEANEKFFYPFHPEEAKVFALTIKDVHQEHVYGDLMEVDYEELLEDIKQNGIHFSHIDAKLKSGPDVTFTPEQWEAQTKSDLQEVARRFAPSDLQAVRQHLDNLDAHRYAQGIPMSAETFLSSFNENFMQVVRNGQDDMIRIPLPVAEEMIRYKDASVYSMVPEGITKLSPLDTLSSGRLRQPHYQNLAIKKTDLEGVNKWADREIKRITRPQPDRDVRENTKTHSNEPTL